MKRSALRRVTPLRRRTVLKRVTRLKPQSQRGEVVDILDSLLRQAVLLRDGFRCRRCGRSPQVRGDGTKAVPLVAAHIYGKGAHPGMRCVLENVLCLCDGPQSCHRWWHDNGFGQTGIVRQWVTEEVGSSAMARLDEMAAQDGLGSFDLDRARHSLEQAIRRLSTPLPYSDYDRTRSPIARFSES